MSIHRKTYIQQLPITLEEAWEFFSRPDNLAKVTPPDMKFRITNGVSGSVIHEGMIITYAIAVIPVPWTTEISRVVKNEMFEDRQIAGPFDLWQHRHLFRAIEGGVEMTDVIDYQLPLGPLGEFANALVVDRLLDQLFRYRRRMIGDLFSSEPARSEINR